MKISVGSLNPDERNEWEMLYSAYAEFYKVPMNTGILETVWDWIFDVNDEFYALVARNEEKRVIGLMHFRQMPSPLLGKKVGFLDDLFVLPELRGTGVVDQMFQKLSLEAAEKGWTIVSWITEEDNYRGRAVYDRTAKKTNWVTYELRI